MSRQLSQVLLSETGSRVMVSMLLEPRSADHCGGAPTLIEACEKLAVSCSQ